MLSITTLRIITEITPPRNLGDVRTKARNEVPRARCLCAFPLISDFRLHDSSEVELRAVNARVAGSIPARAAILFGREANWKAACFENRCPKGLRVRVHATSATCGHLPLCRRLPRLPQLPQQGRTLCLLQCQINSDVPSCEPCFRWEIAKRQGNRL